MDIALQEAAIRERAYAIWEQEGRPDGREWDHWNRALSELASAPPAPRAVKPRKTAVAAGTAKAPSRKSPAPKAAARKATKTLS